MDKHELTILPPKPLTLQHLTVWLMRARTVRAVIRHRPPRARLCPPSITHSTPAVTSPVHAYRLDLGHGHPRTPSVSKLPSHTGELLS